MSPSRLGRHDASSWQRGNRHSGVTQSGAGVACLPPRLSTGEVSIDVRNGSILLFLSRRPSQDYGVKNYTRPNTATALAL
eukprot:5294043-Pyramimonas_sp.AAC.1